MKNINSCDVLIIGGGINGVGIALEAKERGLSVCLVEKGELACQTSSASTKLIHGGLRYLEHFQFGLVKESLHERAILMKKAPNLVKPLKFVLPVDLNIRSNLKLAIGLKIYDFLARGSNLPHSRKIKLTDSNCSNQLQEKYVYGYEYHDCWTNDKQLVMSNAMTAEKLGANILTNTEIVNISSDNEKWLINLKNKNYETKIKAKVIINATGPWVNQTISDLFSLTKPLSIRFVKGSHIVIKRIYSGNHAYIFQHNDQRVIFAIPYQNKYTLIGTTDVEVNNLENIKASEVEIDYLINAVNQYFKHPVDKNDVAYTFAGVRPLVNDNASPAENTREYKIVSSKDSMHPLLHIYGGKLTTYRSLAEKAVDKLKPFFPFLKPSISETTVLNISRI